MVEYDNCHFNDSCFEPLEITRDYGYRVRKSLDNSVLYLLLMFKLVCTDYRFLTVITYEQDKTLLERLFRQWSLQNNCIWLQSMTNCTSSIQT
jgi:hypothetical protein